MIGKSKGAPLHSRRELKKAGLFDKDSDYNAVIGNAVMELIVVFAKQERNVGCWTYSLN